MNVRFQLVVLRLQQLRSLARIVELAGAPTEIAQYVVGLVSILMIHLLKIVGIGNERFSNQPMDIPHRSGLCRFVIKTNLFISSTGVSMPCQHLAVFHSLDIALIGDLVLSFPTFRLLPDFLFHCLVPIVVVVLCITTFLS